MTPQQFIQKWRACQLKERSASQSHFIDLCHLLNEQAPTDADPEGTSYCFEAGAKKLGGGDGWADVWKKYHFAWEYKGKRANLDAAYVQLQRYAVALENPPLLVVSDMETIRIHTNFTNTVQQVHVLVLDDLLDESKRRILKWVFTDPEQLKPGITREQLTEDAARQFAEIAQTLHSQQHDPQRVAHFINKVLFCLFAEDIGILPKKLFTRLLEAASKRPDRFEELIRRLFVAMKDGGDFDLEVIYWFNGGLFDDDDVLPLGKPEIDRLLKLAAIDWSAIEPSIFGTLFERGLDPSKRSQLGAHYTDRTSIMRIVEPVVLKPLEAAWEGVRDEVRALLERTLAAKDKGSATKLHEKAKRAYFGFLQHLQDFRILDPACGSGNFLYLSLLGLKDLEHKVILEGEVLGLQPPFPMVDPQAVLGIEINPYAAELARLTVWIGQIQWMLKNGYDLATNPVLQKLDQIDCRDALLNPDGTEAKWPPADCIIGNPPFLGDRQHRRVLGETYTVHLRAAYAGRVPARADFVVYWVMKAAEKAIADDIQGFGLVATKSIAKGASRAPLDLLTQGDRDLIYNAWTNEAWTVEGADVRVSIVCAAAPGRREVLGSPVLNGETVSRINPDLTSGVDVTKARRLRDNVGVAFQGVKLTGPFDLTGATARELLQCPLNPNGRPNSDVIARLYDIGDIVGRDSDRWVIDFGTGLSESEAALYEEPFRIVENLVVPFRNDPEQTQNGERRLVEKYWEFQRPSITVL